MDYTTIPRPNRHLPVSREQDKFRLLIILHNTPRTHPLSHLPHTAHTLCNRSTSSPNKINIQINIHRMCLNSHFELLIHSKVSLNSLLVFISTPPSLLPYNNKNNNNKDSNRSRNNNIHNNPI